MSAIFVVAATSLTAIATVASASAGSSVHMVIRLLVRTPDVDMLGGASLLMAFFILLRRQIKPHVLLLVLLLEAIDATARRDVVEEWHVLSAH